MSAEIPVHLGKDSIVESVFEVRFQSQAPITELLPGMLFQQLQGEFPKLINLPLHDMPSVVRQHDSNLRYQPVVRLLGDNRNIGIGDKVISLGINKPYPGWDKKKELVTRLLSLIEDTDLIESVERYSLKYVNILPAEAGNLNFDEMKVALNLGDFVLSNFGIDIKAEIVINDLTNLVNVSQGIFALNEDKTNQIPGTLIAVDTIKNIHSSDFALSDILNEIDESHRIEKTVFFGLLKEETIEKMQPQWSK